MASVSFIIIIAFGCPCTIRVQTGCQSPTAVFTPSDFLTFVVTRNLNSIYQSSGFTVHSPVLFCNQFLYQDFPPTIENLLMFFNGNNEVKSAAAATSLLPVIPVEIFERTSAKRSLCSLWALRLFLNIDSILSRRSSMAVNNMNKQKKGKLHWIYLHWKFAEQ